MLKKFFQTSGDTLLFMVLFGIISSSFLAVLALSPIQIDSTATNVLGADTEKTVDDLNFVEFKKVSQNSNFNFISNNKNNFKFELKKQSPKNLSEELVEMENISDYLRTISVRFQIPQNYSSLSTINLKFQGESQKLNFTEGVSNSVVLNILPRNRVNLEVEFNSLNDINFNLPFEVIFSN